MRHSRRRSLPGAISSAVSFVKAPAVIARPLPRHPRRPLGVALLAAAVAVASVGATVALVTDPDLAAAIGPCAAAPVSLTPAGAPR